MASGGERNTTAELKEHKSSSHMLTFGKMFFAPEKQADIRNDQS